VSIFTNVVWDTSQAYAHAFFDSMLDWLEWTVRECSNYPDTLFVIRVHPHDARPGLPSREPIAEWLRASGFLSLPNLVVIGPDEEDSSYELISLSKFCVVYNSTLGLEAAMMRKFSLCGAWTRYRGSGGCYDITSKEDYQQKLRELLEIQGPVVVSEEWVANARRYFYFCLFKASLDLSAFLEPSVYTKLILNSFDADALSREHSPEMKLIVDGILEGREFYCA